MSYALSMYARVKRRFWLLPAGGMSIASAAFVVDDPRPEQSRALVAHERLCRDVELRHDGRYGVKLLSGVGIHQRTFDCSASSLKSSRSRSVSFVGTCATSLT